MSIMRRGTTGTAPIEKPGPTTAAGMKADTAIPGRQTAAATPHAARGGVTAAVGSRETVDRDRDLDLGSDTTVTLK
jgi:hypothetical protein